MHVWKRWFWPQKLSMNATRFESAFWNAVYSKSAFWNAVYSENKHGRNSVLTLNVHTFEFNADACASKVKGINAPIRNRKAAFTHRRHSDVRYHGDLAFRYASARNQRVSTVFTIDKPTTMGVMQSRRTSNTKSLRKEAVECNMRWSLDSRHEWNIALIWIHYESPLLVFRTRFKIGPCWVTRWLGDWIRMDCSRVYTSNAAARTAIHGGSAMIREETC